MATEQSKQDSPAKTTGPGVRGVSYPAISLKEAVDRARQLWDHEHKNAAPMEAVAAHWGYSPSSSGVRTMVAALLSFGLVSDLGSGDKRQIQLSPLGLDIVLDTPEREEALRKAMMNPKIYAELIALWPPANLPSDQTLRVHLLRHKNFNPKAVDSFIKDFKDSIGFSGLAKAASIPGIESDGGEAVDMQEVPLERYSPQIAAQRVASGERDWLRGSLSKDAQYRLLITGEIGPKEIGKLIKLLEAQKAVLDEDED